MGRVGGEGRRLFGERRLIEGGRLLEEVRYPDPRLSGLFNPVPLSPDNRGSTVT